jgi:pilus assembly protein FimV
MSNNILYIQKGNQLYNKNNSSIIGNRRLYSLGAIKKKVMILKNVQKKQRRRYCIIVPQHSSSTAGINKNHEKNYTETSVEPQLEQQVESQTEPYVEQEVEPYVEPPVEPPQVESPLEPPVEPEVKLQVEPEVEPDIEPQTEQQVELEVEPEVEPEVELQVEVPVEPEVEIIPNENYTDLLPLELLNLLSKYPTAKNYGIIYITNVILNTLCNDTTTTVTRELPFYNAFAFGTYLVLGKTYSLTVTICDINITYPAAIVSVWIDWNQINSYNKEDWIQLTSNTPIGESATVEIVVPMTAKLGTTGMRIRSRGASDGNKNGAKDAYVDMGSGDTQDYPITILSEEL